MLKVRHWLLNAGTACLVLFLVAACIVQTTHTNDGNESQGARSVSWRESYLQLGRETYQRACASCHDDGSEGAPAMGDREAWAGRSPMWSAVLIEHAKGGYLDMPAKGGHPELTDRAVEAAGEYMLSETYPELPVD